ncbi:hypothetical protein CORC01_05674 [Colletotrichum orchidophilum]|uniref:Uncharacterized protein n=1 Tax=Colletotrichum orchidophilum TaxID=1209926 RepID=A0A1G4BC44_9PEZI|nr:uncharacterized protein CORC01_05674 [Colletotrichum orchidophilum]OHE98984.1 hypothetical protein CORC01_05674 [Colletotrichum orchidophilum]
MDSNLQPEPDDQMELFLKKNNLISDILASTSTIISSFQQPDKQQAAISGLLEAASKIPPIIHESNNENNEISQLLMATGGIVACHLHPQFQQAAIANLLAAISNVVASVKKVNNAHCALSQVVEDQTCYFDHSRSSSSARSGTSAFRLAEFTNQILREVNREARAFCMQVGKFRFGYNEDDMKHGTFGSIWYNDKLDAMYISNFRQWSDQNVLQVKNVVIGDAIVLNPNDCADILTGDCWGCDNLTIAYQPRGAPAVVNRGPTPQELKNTIPVFYAINDGEERVCAEVVDLDDWGKGKMKTWDQHRAELEEFFHQDEDKKRVIFRAVEVFRRPFMMY